MSTRLPVGIVASFLGFSVLAVPLGAQLPHRAFFSPVPDDAEYLLGLSVQRSRDRLFAVRDLSAWFRDPLFFARPGIDQLRTIVVPGRFAALPEWDALYLDGRFDLSPAGAGLTPYAALGTSASHVAYRPEVLRDGGRSRDRYLALAVGSIALLVDLTVFEPRLQLAPVVTADIFARVPEDAIIWASVRAGPSFYGWLLRSTGQLFPSPGVEPRHIDAFLGAATSVVAWVSEREVDTLRVLVRYPGSPEARDAADLLRFLLFPLAGNHAAFPLFDIAVEGDELSLSLVSVVQLAAWLRPLPRPG